MDTNRRRYRGPVDKPLSNDAFAAALDAWAGSEVAVRVVVQERELLMVAHGYLGGRSSEKRPALFWPLSAPEGHEHAEHPGIYMHPEVFETAFLREGGSVIELHQAGTTLNLRRLEHG